eukprot:11180729-Lingulodinium_polyedra.AAC.1
MSATCLSKPQKALFLKARALFSPTSMWPWRAFSTPSSRARGGARAASPQARAAFAQRARGERA